jgi:Pyruvate/2-oxoacid:ferredoxin oxidoreductase delta subunit
MKLNSPSLLVVKDSADEINQLHEANCTHARQTIENAIRIGELLSMERAKRKYGEWLPWLEASIKFSRKTADNYQRIYNQRSKLVNVINLTEAYRISLPKESKAKNRKVIKSKALTLHMFMGTCTMENPLPSWRIIEDFNRANNQMIVCTQCWTYCTGWTILARKENWNYGCHCPQSERSAVVKLAKS